MKLSHQSWVPGFVSSFFDGEVSGTQKDDETYVKAAKVILLLRHAANLGNMDALFTLAAISLASSSSKRDMLF